mmetsp:Transcript_8850/g.13639  ORF Transcript_8850/g.13639 Transcript_8850/m.13639 type:complete len:200 (+) Transcript_8850:320-919(+)
MGQHLVNFLDGYNMNIMAYGQTGSGKTYTMIGPKGGFDYPASEDSIPSVWGMFPRFLHALYLQIKDDKMKALSISVKQDSMFFPEDLITRKQIRFVPDMNEYIGHKEVILESFEDIVRICKIIEKVRASRSTKMNTESSRIHCFMNLKLYQCNANKMVQCSQCRFVDLCGSERNEVMSEKDEGARMESVLNNFNLLLLL